MAGLTFTIKTIEDSIEILKEKITWVLVPSVASEKLTLDINHLKCSKKIIEQLHKEDLI